MKFSTKINRIATLFCVLISTQIWAQDAEDDILDMSLEELMNMEISVGSANKMSLRETPGIVTVISNKEIQNSGARDLVDVLRLVPGMEISGDSENVIGLGVRGNYAMEGKVLLLVDGQQMNEVGYGTATFGNRYLTDNIQKVEVIRGPGSAIYGGLAELAVINVITKSGSDLDGGYASASYGVSNGSKSRINGQFGVGKKLDNGLSLSLTGSYSTANRSNEKIGYATNFLDAEEGASTIFNYADSSKTNNIDLNADLKYKGLSVKAIYNDHAIEVNGKGADWLKFGGIYLGAKYEWQANERLTITPEFSWKKELPWTYNGNLNNEYRQYYLAESFRTRGNVTGLFKVNETISITFGAEAYSDKLQKPSDTEPLTNGGHSVSYSNIAGFTEVLFESSIANIIVGGRYDNHSRFGGAFVPRFAITRAWDSFHVKGLLSRAFKAPVIYNFEVNPDIKAEFTTVAEIEAGYKFNANMSVIGNVFYLNIEDPILYEFDDLSEEEFYFNYEKASTIGLELTYRLNYNWGYINSSYSYYKNNNSVVEPYEVSNDKNLLRGFPAHKIALNAGINIGDKFKVGPTVIYNSKKVGYFAQEEYWEGDDFYTYDPTFIMNLSLNYEVISGLNLSITGYDLFEQKLVAANAYDAWYPGTPTIGREIIFKAKFQF